MDRFIATKPVDFDRFRKDLKSNMDRFIGKNTIAEFEIYSI